MPLKKGSDEIRRVSARNIYAEVSVRSIRAGVSAQSIATVEYGRLSFGGGRLYRWSDKAADS